MNDPKDQPIDIDDQRTWLIEYKRSSGQSWGQIATRLGLKVGTLSQFGTPKGYTGNEVPLAEAVFRYRQTLASQAMLRVELPEIPGYFPTATSNKLIYLLRRAQEGRIVTAAMGAGLGKTTTARHYAACNSNVFLVTCSPSASGVFAIQHKVLKAMGDLNATGAPYVLTMRIERMAEALESPLLILDEAQHLTEKALEEIRTWHDTTGMGIALFGNESVQQRLEGGNRAAVFAQLFSRQAQKLVRSFPLKEDIEALLEAWRVHDEEVARQVDIIARKPGGLRGATFTLEMATMLAMADQTEMTVQHVTDAWAQLSARVQS